MVKRTHCKSYVIWFRPKSPTHRQGFDNTWTCSWKTYQHSWSAIRYGMPSWWGSKNTPLEWYVQEINTGEVTASSKDNEKKN